MALPGRTLSVDAMLCHLAVDNVQRPFIFLPSPFHPPRVSVKMTIDAAKATEGRSSDGVTTAPSQRNMASTSGTVGTVGTASPFGVLPAHHPIGRKLAQIMNTPLTMSTGLMDSLNHLAHFYGHKNGEQDRRKLRYTLERQRTDCHRAFLRQMEKVVQEYKSLEDQLEGIANQCKDMRLGLRNVQGQTAHLIQETHRLQNQKYKTTISSFIVSCQLIWVIRVQDDIRGEKEHV